MSKIHTLSITALAAMACLSSSPASAQDTPYSYVGVSLGQARAKVDEDRIVAGQLGAGITSTGIHRDERDTGYRLMLGQQFNPWWAMELSYFNLGNFHFDATTSPAGTLRGEMAVQGGGLDLVGGLPFGNGWKAIGRVGVQYAKTRDRFGGTGAVTIANPSPSDRDTNVKVGLGLEYAINRSFSMRTEMERYRMSDGVGGKGHANVVSVSLLFPFGRAPAARTSMAPAYVAPAPVVAAAPPPAPAPVIVVMAAPAPAPMPVVAPPVQRTRVSFSAESLFGFDKSTVRPEGKAALDTFAQSLTGTQFDQIVIEGHTDRLGTVAYNQKLSQERAEAVKAYLVTEGRIDPTKISAVGKSESTPVTKPEDCKGNHATAALITCLQPDRRVDVEVSATR